MSKINKMLNSQIIPTSCRRHNFFSAFELENLFKEHEVLLLNTLFGTWKKEGEEIDQIIIP